MPRKHALILPAFAAFLVVAAACTTFAPAADGNPDAATSPDAAMSSEAGATDAAVAETSSAEAGTAGDGGVLVGSINAAGPTTDDPLSEGSLDAHGFVALSSGTARQMDLYVRQWPIGMTALVGVYSDVENLPATLLAQGTVTKSATSTPGWARAQLSPEVTIVKSTTYWLAFYAPTNKLIVRSKPDVACPFQLQFMGIGGGQSSLPATFVPSSSYSECEAAVYLSP